MTPTNEAGHGLPELLPCPFCGGDAERIDFGPGDAENAGGSCIACKRCQSSGAVEFGYKENFISNWNRRAALALSRGVPEPVWIVNDLGELGVMVAGTAYFLYKGDNIVYEDAAHDDGTPMLYRIVGKREFGETCWPLKWVEAGRREDRYTEKLHYAAGLSFGKPEDGDWRPLPIAAPAAAGAQGEAVCSNCNGRGEVGGPVGQTAETFDYVTEPCPECTPQPAAADGGVRERARALFDAMLAAPYGSTMMGDIVCAETTCDRLESAWLPILEAALSSHRQAGDGLSKFRELAEGWRDGVGIDLETRLQCADDLMALVEKGAGNG